MPVISYQNLRNDSSLLQTVWSADGIGSGAEYNMITGWERGGSGSGIAYILSPCWHVRLRSSTWGLTAKSTSSVLAQPYDPVTRTWLTGFSWGTAQASGTGSNKTKDSTNGHNYVDSAMENTYPTYGALHLWKLTFYWSHSGANTGTYNYCCFYPSYRMSEQRFNVACKWKLGNESNGHKLIYGIQPRMMYINTSVSELTPFAGEMWRCNVPSEQYLIDTFVDHDNLAFKDPFLSGISLSGTGDILTSFRPTMKNICYCA